MDTLQLCFCHTYRLPLLPLVWGEHFNLRAAFYSGISSAWAQMRLDLINWCCGYNSLGAKGNGKA